MDREAPFDRVLAAARAGEGWALAELFRDLHPRIRRYLMSFAPAVADDVASDTWLDVVRSLDRFRGDASDVRALAFSFARTRLSEVRDMTPLDEDVIASLEATPRIDASSPAPAADVDAALRTLDTDAALERVMALPVEHAEVILLRVLGGLSIDEVAATVGKPARAVRSIERDALQHLAIVMTEQRTTR